MTDPELLDAYADIWAAVRRKQASRNREYIRPREREEPMDALQDQVGGDHYKNLAIQPVEYIHKNQLPFIEGSVVKYVTRWRAKGGVDDLRKARHFLDLLIQMETGKP